MVHFWIGCFLTWHGIYIWYMVYIFTFSIGNPLYKSFQAFQESVKIPLLGYLTDISEHIPVLPRIVVLVLVESGVERDCLTPLDGVLGGDVARVAQEGRVAPELVVGARQTCGRVAQLHHVEVLHQVVGRLDSG